MSRMRDRAMNEFFDDLTGFGWEPFRQKAKRRHGYSKHSCAAWEVGARIPRRAYNAGGRAPEVIGARRADAVT